jgi:UDP-glucuronate 4-epimerase
MARYLVTGCAGFIGSHLTEALLARGDEVFGVDAFTDYYERDLKERNLSIAREHTAFSLLEVDLAETELPPLLEGVDGVFHLAAQPGVRASWGTGFDVYVHNNLRATQRLFEAASAAGVRVAFASSSSVYGDAESYPTREDGPKKPVSPYGITKLTCEELARVYGRSFGLDVVALRYFTVYGPRQRPDMAFARIAAALVSGGPFLVLGSGEQSRDFTFVSDAVAATIAALERGDSGAIYNVGGGSETTLLEAIEALERHADRKLDVRFSDEAPGDVRRTASDTSAIRLATGWSPAIALDDGLEAQLRYVEAQREGPAPVGQP